ncbi:protein phosphatase [Nocardioides cavernae]|uniref:Protein phosphatase n=1 Tax=Nocardioides cavernae TaxID=1921566 RepID=A0ABR8NDQ8_9ACTN|nr:protein-tyrosine phosphatase family protein [Nocardioides cavernae]MBD3926268.1 protein phosphatase [Nocardioides cavernae]MBM7513861.1 hypothetical protein [Nocardioides cavernae]
MGAGWEPTTPGVLVLPSGRTLRGCPLADVGGAGRPDFGLHLAAEAPPPPGWPSRWIRWRDFRTPSDPEDAREALIDTWRRSSDQRVEVACRGGRGRTGTALACLAVIDGMPTHEAVAFVRRSYHPAAVETPWQRRFVQRFGRP